MSQLRQEYQAALKAFHSAPEGLHPEQIYCLYYKMRDTEDALRAEESKGSQQCLFEGIKPLAVAAVVGTLAAISTTPTEASFQYSPVGLGWVVETLPIAQTLPVKAATGLRVLNPWGAAIGLGITAAAMLIQDMLDNQIMTTPANNAPAPEGWSGWDTPPDTTPGLYKWSTSATYGGCGGQTAFVYWSPTEACQAALSCYETSFGWSPGFTGTAPNGSTNYFCQGVDHNPPHDTMAYASAIRSANAAHCRAGYTWSGTRCDLTSPAAVKWPSDGKPTYQSTGSGWKTHPRDPDLADPNIAPNSSIPILLDQNGLDEYFNRVRQTVKSTPDGGMEFKQQIETPDAVGNTQVVEKTLVFDNSGQVIENNQTTTNTTINQAAAPPPQNPGELPTDYAREATAQSIRDALTTPAELPTNEGAPTFQETLDAFWTTIQSGGLIGAVSNITVPQGAGECPTGSFDFFGQQLTFDSHCALMESVSPALMVVSIAAWSLVGLRIILSA